MAESVVRQNTTNILGPKQEMRRMRADTSAAEPFAAPERETRAAIERTQRVRDRSREPWICNVLYLHRPPIQ
ncbi:hypothetical protein [Burkholderia sp. AU45388]|uniref:hypothetical protein n=1 Tax=Burkholderia sp. AU45388 TaxID=3059206 RepID=UPI0026512154|nr:hypothetical protein [Burkholderia sp. AU45388]MDN7428821.1 hypothetical protein [Burkholderia sp. AU45388]